MVGGPAKVESARHPGKVCGPVGERCNIANLTGGAMTIDRRQFTKLAGAGAATAVLAWQQACVQVAETGEVSAETVSILLDAQGPRGIYGEAEEFERLRRAVANSIQISEQLRSFELDDDEHPLTIFRRG